MKRRVAKKVLKALVAGRGCHTRDQVRRAKAVFSRDVRRGRRGALGLRFSSAIVPGFRALTSAMQGFVKQLSIRL